MPNYTVLQSQQPMQPSNFAVMQTTYIYIFTCVSLEWIKSYNLVEEIKAQVAVEILWLWLEMATEFLRHQ